jgi:multisubunit Na+/H+ antiporter MnhB subunit
MASSRPSADSTSRPATTASPTPRIAKRAQKDHEFQKKWKTGPVGLVQIWKPDISMGKCMVLTFIVYLVIGVFIAYLAWAALPHAGVSFAQDFQITGTAGVLAYCFSFIPSHIWFQAYPRATAMCLIDGVVYGLLTGAIFAALWPSAELPVVIP